MPGEVKDAKGNKVLNPYGLVTSVQNGRDVHVPQNFKWPSGADEIVLDDSDLEGEAAIKYLRNGSRNADRMGEMRFASYREVDREKQQREVADKVQQFTDLLTSLTSAIGSVSDTAKNEKNIRALATALGIQGASDPGTNPVLLWVNIHDRARTNPELLATKLDGLDAGYGDSLFDQYILANILTIKGTDVVFTPVQGEEGNVIGVVSAIKKKLGAKKSPEALELQNQLAKAYADRLAENSSEE